MNESHIEQCATSYCKKNASAPKMEQDTKSYAEKLWQAMIAGEEGHILEAIDDEHTEDGTSQIAAKKPNETRSMLLRREENERQSAGSHGSHSYE